MAGRQASVSDMTMHPAVFLSRKVKQTVAAPSLLPADRGVVAYPVGKEMRVIKTRDLAEPLALQA